MSVSVWADSIYVRICKRGYGLAESMSGQRCEGKG
jgi:hypothetical protein